MRNFNAKGTLIIIGGAEDRTGKKDILSRVLQSSSKRHNIVVGLISSATEFPNETAESYKKAFFDLGAKDLVHFDIRKHDEADTEKNLKYIDEVDVVFFSGGDQYRLVHILGETKIMSRINERFQHENVVIAGTSAGAACMSNPMIFDGDAEQGFLRGTVKVNPGFGLLPGCVIDTHFIARSRIGRLTQTLAMNPKLLGIGLEEDTALIVKRTSPAEVIGSGAVVILEASQAKYNGILKAEFNDPFTFSAVKMHLLTNGVKFNLEKRLMSQSITNSIYKV